MKLATLLLALLVSTPVWGQSNDPVAPCPANLAFDTQRVGPKIIFAETFGAKGDGVTDDTVALQAALDSLTGGGTLQLMSGKTYMKTRVVTVKYANVRVWGYGATIYNYVPLGFVPVNNNHMQSLALRGANSRAIGIRFISNIGKRTGGNELNSAILLAADGVQAIDNIIDYAMVGIMARYATNYLVARNVITRAWADSIHSTQGTSFGKFFCNIVREGGDDGVAIVNYGPGPPTIHDYEVAYNDVRGSYRGRGYSVVGGANVKIHDNYVARLCKNAGIYIAVESSYSTANVNGVEVWNNTVKDIELDPPTYDPGNWCQPLTQQAGIHLWTNQDPNTQQRIDNVLVRNNTVDRVFKYGLYAYKTRGCNLVQVNNTVTNATIKPIIWEQLRCPEGTPAPAEEPIKEKYPGEPREE